MTTKLTREGTLAELVNLGNELVQLSNPSRYPFEKRNYAKTYEPWLAATRQCWRAIKNGAHIETELKKLAKVINTGIESNRLRLIAKASILGFDPTDNWKIVDDRITFQSRK